MADSMPVPGNAVEVESLVIPLIGDASSFDAVFAQVQADLQTHVASVEQATAQIEQEQDRLFHEGARVFESVKTPMERYASEVANLEQLHEAGAISTETYTRAMRNLRQEFSTIGADLEMVGGKMKSLGMTLSATVTAPIVGLAALSAREFGGFQQGLLEIESAASPTAAEMKNLRDEAMALSQDLGVDPTETVKGFTELLKAGMSVEDVLAGAGKQAKMFAEVGELETEMAATTMADAMTVFGTSAEKTVNTLSSAADASSVSIGQITEAFAQASAVAGQANQSLNDVAAGIAVLGKFGVKGSDAGTSLKTMFLRLMAPVDKGAKVFKEYNLQMRDATGQMKPLAGIVGELQAKFGDLDQITRDRVLADLFGQDAIRAGQIFLSTGTKGLEQFQKTMAGANSVADKYQTQTSGLNGEWAKMTAALSRLQIQIGETLNKTLGGAMQTITEYVGKAAEWIANHEELATVLMGVAGAAALVGPALVIGGSVTASIGALSKAYIFLSTSQKALMVTTTALKFGLAGLAIGGIVYLSKKIYESMPSIKAFNQEMERATELANKLNDVDSSKQEKILKTAERISDVGQRKLFLASELEKAKKEAEGLDAAVGLNKKNLAGLNAEIRDHVDEIKKAYGPEGMPGLDYSQYRSKEVEVVQKSLDETSHRAEVAKKFVDQLQESLQAANETSVGDAMGPEASGAIDEDENEKLAAKMAQDAEKYRTPLEQFNTTLAELDQLLQADKVSAEAYNMAIKKAQETLRDSDPIAKMTRELQFQRETMGLNERQINIWKMAQEGATKEQVHAAMAIDKEMTALEKATAIMKRAEEQAKKYLSPMEKFKQTEAELTDLFNKKLISLEAFRFEMKDARDELSKGIHVDFTVTGVESVLAGSQEALNHLESLNQWMYTDSFQQAQQEALQFQTDMGMAEQGKPGQLQEKPMPKDPSENKFDERIEKLLASIADNTKQDRFNKIVLQPSGLK